MTGEIRILIADDHAIVREGFRRIIEREPALKVIAEAADGRHTVELAAALKPDIAVIDFNMPEQNGVEVIGALRRAQLDTKVILLTMHDDRHRFTEAIDAGAAGYVLKDGSLMEIVQAIHIVNRGGNYISPPLTAHLLKHRTESAAFVNSTSRLNALTAAERRILRFVADGLTNKNIAERLFVSVRTVEDHRANICDKLQLHGINALLKFALAHRAELPEP